ncbi:MAG: RusA family crossover junction endodeoxyribonuclease [Opitutales bacterium]|nr:RusA family crossover junction endodeoxyribonuclease [Opitutales bacterium]
MQSSNNRTYWGTFIPCIPPTTTAQQHKRIFRTKDGRTFLGTDKKGTAVQNELCALLSVHRPPENFPRYLPVSCRIRLFFPYRKTEKKTPVKLRQHIAHIARPDADNLVKFLLDCMTRCNFWHDDSQIFHLCVEKYYHAEPGIQIDLSAFTSEIIDAPNVFPQR